MALNVEGKTAIITGAGSGINFCFAELLLSRGCNVILADLALRPEAEQLVSRYPLSGSNASKTPRAVFQRTDVRDWAQLDKMFAVATEHFGGADIVCPGAGIFEPVSLKFPAQIARTDSDSNGRTSGTLLVAHLPKTMSPSPDMHLSMSILSTPYGRRSLPFHISSSVGSRVM
jgi:3-hydroxybutyrate dehydrogenase